MEARIASYLSSKEHHFKRLEATRLAFLTYFDARYAACGYFEGPIDSKEKTFEAMRISLEAWDDPWDIVQFSKSRMLPFENVDYDLAAQWRDNLHGPLYCMETRGQTALLMSEGHVFEVASFGRTWDDMVPFTPDIILATLLPYDDIIVSDGLLMHHHSKAIGPGVKRVQREFEIGLECGIVDDAEGFVRCAREINRLHREEGFDPTSFYVLNSYIDEVNARTFETCFPYETTARLRSWDAA